MRPLSKERPMKLQVTTLAALALLVIATSSPAISISQNSSANSSAAQTPSNQERGLSPKGRDRIIKEVHHELVLLPYYGVFDNLAYQVSDDGVVTLLGQVARPTLKSDAEN